MESPLESHFGIFELECKRSRQMVLQFYLFLRVKGSFFSRISGTVDSANLKRMGNLKQNDMA